MLCYLCPFLVNQDDSAMNRKMIAKIISGEKHGQIAGAALLEADDGISAVETLRSEMAAGRKIDFVLMDFVMVICHLLFFCDSDDGNDDDNDCNGV